MNRNLRGAMLVGLALGAGGCSHVSTRVYPVPTPAMNGGQAEMVDLRPATEKVFRIRSSFTTDCEFGIYDFGDQNLSPPPMQILQSTLSSALAPLPAGTRVEVHHFRVINNLQSLIRGTGAPDPGTARPAWATELIVREAFKQISCNAGKEIVGAVDPATNPNARPQILVLIDVALEGRHYTVSHVELYTGSTDQTTAKAVPTAIRMLAEQVRRPQSAR